MPKSSSQVQSREKTENLLRRFLCNSNFEILNETRADGEQGPAVIAMKNGIKYSIEVIGAKSAGPSRSVDFKVALCQAITRLTGYKDERAVVAMPEIYFLKGMPLRAKRFGNYAWQRLGEIFPLELWFVSTQGVEQHKWNKYL